MANYNSALQRLTNKYPTHLMLAEKVGHETIMAVFPEMSSAKDVSNLPNLNGLKKVYQRVWARMFGDSMTSQQLSEFLFPIFLRNIEKAEKAVATWICQKLGIPTTDQLTEEMVLKLNDLIDDLPTFQDEINAILTQTQKVTWWKKGLLWLAKLLFGK